MRTIARPLLFFCATLLYGSTFAAQPDWLVDTLYKSGKINTVVAVMAVIIAGLCTWMFVMDRKVRRMENDLKNR